jgi:polysaccharide export outer membrane protein
VPSDYDIELGPSLPPKVTLAPGDVVNIKFYYAPDLNELAQTVRPDGKITLQLVGDVDVEGKTPAEVSDELHTLFAPHLKNPEAAVIVQALVNRRVWVGGQVYAGGMFEMPGRMTVLDAVMQAGGFITETAKVSNVVVIRHKNGLRYGASVDLRPALAGEPHEPFFLEPCDIVYVPQTTIAEVGQWIDTHINRIIPIGFTYGYQISNRAFIGIDTGGTRVIGR